MPVARYVRRSETPTVPVTAATVGETREIAPRARRERGRVYTTVILLVALAAALLLYRQYAG